MQNRFARIVFPVCLVAIALVTCLHTGAQEAGQEEPPLPLKRVVLFSSSVGFFEHRGEVDGTRKIEFAFKTSDINDLLKSLVVQDRSGGLVTAVNYGSPEPMARTLRTFAVDLTASPSLAQIFQQLRGHRVKLETPASVSGVVVGVEKRRMPPGDKETIDSEVLNLRTERGLQSFRIDSISRTELLDPKVDQEFQQALDLIAQAHSSEQKRVKLDFRGDGRRDVSVGYIQEAPVWKTSYRLVLSDGEAPFLQGWAIVENTTAQDWRDVQLTLVSGRPISFLMDLYEPLFMTRPLVTPQQHASLRPRVYEQDLAARNQEFEAAAGQPLGGRRRGGGMFGGMGGMGGGMGGMGGGMGGGMMGGMGGGGFGGGQAGTAQRPFATGLAPAADAGSRMDLTQGVAASANGEDVGELFRYVITAPVTLGRNQSAMLPIVNDAVKGEKVVIYNPAVHAKHPLSGLRLTNTTPLHLLQGPITVFDSGEYAGDARIEAIGPGSTRLISYALDLETEIAIENKPAEQVTVGVQIYKGGLHLKHKGTFRTEYVIKNSSRHAKQMLIERPIDSSSTASESAWHVVKPQPAEKTRSLQRFACEAEPGKPMTLVVIEERDVSEDFLLKNLNVNQLELHLSTPAASPALVTALQQALTRKSAVAEIEAKRADIERRLSNVEREQVRMRSNVNSVPDINSNDPFAAPNKKLAGELLQRYLTKLADLENDLDKERAALDAIKQEEARAVRDLEDFLESLVVE